MENDANPLILTLPQNPSNGNSNGSEQSQTPPQPRRQPKRFVKNQIPDSITNDPALNAAIALLPSNYNFEIHKCVWRVRSTGAKRVALQFPEGLLMYSLVISDILTAFAAVDRCFVLGDVTYGACCVDDLSAAALGADLLIHYGHSCLVPVDSTTIPCLYVFVEIKIDVNRLIDTVRLNLECTITKNLILAGTIQFAAAIRAAKSELEISGFRVLVPQSKPLSAGEVLGCTAPTIPTSSFGSADDEVVLVFVADGRFHLEAFMIANPKIRAFRYDPYIGSLFLEEYDHKGMKESRRNAIEKARGAKNWGIVLGTLGRQGNPRILDRLEKKMREKGLDWTVILMSEISPTRVSLFGDSLDAWIQIACPRLSIDWGDAFHKPLLTPFEAEIALGDIPGWWERKTGGKMNLKCNDGMDCEKNESRNDDLNLKCNVGLDCGKNESCCARNDDLNLKCNVGLDCGKNGSCCALDNGGVKVESESDNVIDYPMDYYAQDGGEWNSCYSKKPSRPARRNLVSCSDNVATS